MKIHLLWREVKGPGGWINRCVYGVYKTKNAAEKERKKLIEEQKKILGPSESKKISDQLWIEDYKVEG